MVDKIRIINNPGKDHGKEDDSKRLTIGVIVWLALPATRSSRDPYSLLNFYPTLHDIRTLSKYIFFMSLVPLRNTLNVPVPNIYSEDLYIFQQQRTRMDCF